MNFTARSSPRARCRTRQTSPIPPLPIISIFSNLESNRLGEVTPEREEALGVRRTVVVARLLGAGGGDSQWVVGWSDSGAEIAARRGVRMCLSGGNRSR